MAQEQEYLTRAAEAYRQALDLYATVLGFAEVPRNMRAAQRGLQQVEERIGELSGTTPQPPENRSPISFQPLPGRSSAGSDLGRMGVTYTTAAARTAQRTRGRAARFDRR